ncbi:tRNA (adenosine(37)-N6)-dimethylallyltransferase MiaA [Altererythrobacter sp. MF3-039]|uniref:tRNA (adenosine(37)-N6)-dimethylallyltransferase MiaA n=1 Tax=Altererythrobacter sp. MF3-039 TaxID=3252901 RepID=UPI00390C9BB1
MTTGKTPERQPVALIAGPTASGKSDLAVGLAQALEKQGRKAAVINADSAQVYADLKVLSARPSKNEMGGIEHLLFGAWDGAVACSAADWAEAAKREIIRLHADDAVPILCGGTGLYMRTLLEGIAPIPPIEPAIREEVRSLAAEDAYSALKAEDPGRAGQLQPGDSQRIARSLEVTRSTGKSLLEWQEEKVGGIANEIVLHPLVLLPDREWLYERCDRRFEMMMERGAIKEVEALLARKLDSTLPVMRAIGVPEIAASLSGHMSREDMISAGQQATRNYAKRQYTWFRRQPPGNWPKSESQNYDLGRGFALLLQV